VEPRCAPITADTALSFELSAATLRPSTRWDHPGPGTRHLPAPPSRTGSGRWSRRLREWSTLSVAPSSSWCRSVTAGAAPSGPRASRTTSTTTGPLLHMGGSTFSSLPAMPAPVVVGSAAGRDRTGGRCLNGLRWPRMYLQSDRWPASSVRVLLTARASAVAATRGAVAPPTDRFACLAAAAFEERARWPGPRPSRELERAGCIRTLHRARRGRIVLVTTRFSSSSSYLSTLAPTELLALRAPACP